MAMAMGMGNGRSESVQEQSLIRRVFGLDNPLVDIPDYSEDNSISNSERALEIRPE
jgi:hypothetical protein